MKTFDEIVDTIRATGKHDTLTFADVRIDGNKYRPFFEPCVVPEQVLNGWYDESFPYFPGDIRWDLGFVRAFVWNYPGYPDTVRALEFTWLLVDASGTYGFVTFSLHNTMADVVPIVFINEFMETGYEGHHFPKIEWDLNVPSDILTQLNKDFGE